MSVVSALDLTFPRDVPLRPSRSRHSSAGLWEMLPALRCPEWRDPISGALPKSGFLVPGVCRSTALCHILARMSEPSPHGIQQRGGRLHLEYRNQRGKRSLRAVRDVLVLWALVPSCGLDHYSSGSTISGWDFWRDGYSLQSKQLIGKTHLNHSFE